MRCVKCRQDKDNGSKLLFIGKNWSDYGCKKVIDKYNLCGDCRAKAEEWLFS